MLCTAPLLCCSSFKAKLCEEPDKDCQANERDAGVGDIVWELQNLLFKKCPCVETPGYPIRRHVSHAYCGFVALQKDKKFLPVEFVRPSNLPAIRIAE